MCETSVYVEKDGKEDLYLENLAVLRVEDGMIYMRSVFGEQKYFEGTLKEISLNEHKIILKK